MLLVYLGSLGLREDGQLRRRRSAPALCGFVRWLLCGSLTCFKSPLVCFWHAALSHRGLGRMYGAIQTLCRVKWVLSSGWRLNVMALSLGSRVFHPLMFALIRRSSALLRNSLVSALLNYAFSWLEYGRRAYHSWTFALNKTDAVSRALRNLYARGCVAVVASFFFFLFDFFDLDAKIRTKAVFLRLKKEKTLNGKRLRMGINSTDGFWADEWHVIKLHIYTNVIVWDLRASLTA